MTKNPYPEFLIDEVSGIRVLDNRHQLWKEGYKAGCQERQRMIVHLAVEGTIEPEEKEEKGVRLPTDERLGRELKTRRLLMDLTLKDLSAKSGVSTSHIGRIEQGKRIPGSRILAKLERALKGRQNEYAAD